jgi:cation transport regulator
VRRDALACWHLLPAGESLVGAAEPPHRRRFKTWTPTLQETFMPYNTVADLPKAQTNQYNPHQKKAFLEAFNNAFKEYKGDESRAFAVAHSAAKKAGQKPGPG